MLESFFLHKRHRTYIYSKIYFVSGNNSAKNFIQIGKFTKTYMENSWKNINRIFEVGWFCVPFSMQRNFEMFYRYLNYIENS